MSPFLTPIARFATRPGSGELDKFESDDLIYETPDLIMGTLMRGGAHLLKSDYIYELVLNEMTGVIELHEKGRSTIGKQWHRAYYDIAIDLGSRAWLTRDEMQELQEQERNKDE